LPVAVTAVSLPEKTAERTKRTRIATT